MTQLSEHFARHEFACKCGCGQDTVDAELITTLEAIREHFGEPITITSGNRCPTYNTKVGGSVYSQHLISRAADIVVRNVTPSDVADWLDQWPGGLGRYPTFTHVDSRASVARWRR